MLFSFLEGQRIPHPHLPQPSEKARAQIDTRTSNAQGMAAAKFSSSQSFGLEGKKKNASQSFPPTQPSNLVCCSLAVLLGNAKIRSHFILALIRSADGHMRLQ